MKENNLAIASITLNTGLGLVYGYYYSFSFVVAFLVIFNVSVTLYLCSRIRKWFLELAPALSHAEARNESIGDYIRHLTILSDEMNRVMAGIGEIGSNSFTSVINTLKSEDIKAPLLSANNGIVTLRNNERASNWITDGVATITGMKHKDGSIEVYAYEAVNAIVKYLEANQGGFFLLREDPDLYLEMVASCAYGKKKYLEKRIEAGQGLLGQVVYEREIIMLTDVPQDYLRITSGLGEALPGCICIIPLLYESKLYGAIEIASFRILDDKALEYLRRISETIGYNLASMESHEKTERLLKETQKMALEVRSNEEELRQNMEELTATQEDMKRRQTEMDAVLSSLSTVEIDPEGHIINANDIFYGITGFRKADLGGRMYKSLIPNHSNDIMQYELMWDSILAGRVFSGEFRIMNSAGKEMWMIGNFTPILNQAGIPVKIMVISLFSNQDKEKLAELQEVVTGIKNCFPMVEINSDMSFKSANELFLTTLGIKRLELKKLPAESVFTAESFRQLETAVRNTNGAAQELVLDICDRAGEQKTYSSVIAGIGSAENVDKRRLLILKQSL